MLRSSSLAAAAIFVFVPPSLSAQEHKPTAEQLRFFEMRIRPVLAESCFKCHGPTKQKGGLRVDSREALLTGGDQGAAVTPSKPADSLLIKALSHDDEPKMPPAKKLPDKTIADLTAWVQMGAPWPESASALKPPTVVRGEYQISAKDRAHWAFQAVQRPALPAVRNAAWIKNPIDAFILAKLETQGFTPSRPAGKRDLLRRVYYDLTGLPPTQGDVESFLADSSPTAYEAVVDRLLASPRYGEKWGRHWLDLVRFAETNSYERDNPKPNAWRFRDYVVRSFNADKPYDQFVREQLAGDETPNAGADGVVATGYYRLGLWDDEPSDRDQARFDELDDIVATTGQVFLGLTFDCARCHDHKIDPIPQKDYYRLVSFFANVNPYQNGGPTDETPAAADPASRKAYENDLQEIAHRRREVESKLIAVEQQFVAAYESKRGGKLRRADLEDLTFRYYRDSWERLPDFASLRPENTGKLAGGLFDLSPRTRDQAIGFVFEGFVIVPKAGKYTFHLDSDDGSRLSVAGKQVLEYDAVHGLGRERRATVDLPQGRLPIKLEYFQYKQGLGLRVAWTGPGFPRRPLSVEERDAELAAAAGGGAAAMQKELAKDDLAKLLRTQGRKLLGDADFRRYQKLQRELQSLHKQKPNVDLALCITERGAEAADTFVQVRGNPHVRGDKVEPEFPLILGGVKPILPARSAAAKTTGRRTVLANWLASTNNPLAARVMANRVWQYHFGRGIVRSASNFGVRGDKPTHPELLDWLAAEFVEQGWRLKPLHRLIVTSNAYRMSCSADAKALASDPANDLFQHFDMRRLTAEEIRDSILAVSGALDLKMFGPSVYVDIPKEVMAGQSVPGSGWGVSSMAEKSRRSLYIHVKRSLLTPILESFDFAETDRSSPVRFATTQPTQALGMLNGAFIQEQAGLLAKRLKREAGADANAQVRLALTLAVSRPADEKEVQRGLKLIKAFQSNDGLTADAALQSYCLMVLNLNEFVYLD